MQEAAEYAQPIFGSSGERCVVAAVRQTLYIEVGFYRSGSSIEISDTIRAKYVEVKPTWTA